MNRPEKRLCLSLADPKVDLYSVSIKHTIQSRPEISFITGGAIITKKP